MAIQRLIEKTVVQAVAAPSANLTAVCLDGASTFSVLAIITVSSPVGAIMRVQGSNDATNWVDLVPSDTVDGGVWTAGATTFGISISAAGNILFTFDSVSTRYMRVRYEITSGTLGTTNEILVLGDAI